MTLIDLLEHIPNISQKYRESKPAIEQNTFYLLYCNLLQGRILDELSDKGYRGFKLTDSDSYLF